MWFCYICRVLLFKICENIGSQQLAELKFFCHDKISTNERDKIQQMEDLFISLERRELVKENNLNFVKAMLTCLNAQKLLSAVSEYEGKY